MLIGICGKTNTGKSTFLKAATLAEVEIANRPFVTLKPNHAIGYVKIPCVCKEFNVKCNPKHGFCLDNNRFVPVELLDVPGLIKNAHKGEGLGLQFLDDIRQADAIIHVIDISGSTNEKGESINIGTYDPLQDIEILENEIDMWFYDILKKDWENMLKKARAEHTEIKKEIAKRFSGLKITEKIVEEVLKENSLDDLQKFCTELRKKSKPIIIAANKIDLNADNLKEIKNRIMIPCSAESELALKEAAKNNLIEYIPGENSFKIINELNEQQKKALEFIKKNILEKYNSTGVQDILNQTVFKLLNYIAVYPVENSHLTDSDKNVLPDVFLLPSGSTALDLAYKIHSDIGDKFVKAKNMKTKQIVGKDYQLQNGDVLEIITK